MLPLLAALALVAPLPLRAADNGRLVAVRAGTAIELRLATTPGTGFAWRFAVRPDPRVVRLCWTRLVEAESGLVGAPATRVWRFRAAGTGTTRLRLVYVRPWQPQRPARTFAVRFRVH